MKSDSLILILETLVFSLVCENTILIYSDRRSIVIPAIIVLVGLYYTSVMYFTKSDIIALLHSKNFIHHILLFLLASVIIGTLVLQNISIRQFKAKYDALAPLLIFLRLNTVLKATDSSPCS